MLTCRQLDAIIAILEADYPSTSELKEIKEEAVTAAVPFPFQHPGIASIGGKSIVCDTLTKRHSLSLQRSLARAVVITALNQRVNIGGFMVYILKEL
nr:unnamed protein product [Callosobruchus analis]